ncbi:hypothetical protein CsatB_024147 [Cannabis sativa]
MVMISLVINELQKGKKRKGSPVIGGGRRRWVVVGSSNNNNSNNGYGVLGDHEEGNDNSNKRFVEALREAQPYIFAHMGRTFVLVLSAEVVASPCLDSILKVILSFPKSHPLLSFYFVLFC